MTERERPGIELNDEQAGWVRVFQQASEQIERMTEVRDEARRHLEEALGEAEIGTVNGVSRVQWTHVSSTRLDQRKLKEQYPDVHAACVALSMTRRFTVDKP